MSVAPRVDVPGCASCGRISRRGCRAISIAGLVLTAVLVPVGMGYAEAAGLPAITGLYATIVPLLATRSSGRAGSSCSAPDSSLAAIIAATILPLAAGDEARAVALAGGLALIAGAFAIAFGLLHLGLLTDLLAKPIRIGYLNGIALTVLVGQLPKLFGFSVDADGLIAEAQGFVQGVPGRRDEPGLARHRLAGPGAHASPGGADRGPSGIVVGHHRHDDRHRRLRPGRCAASTSSGRCHRACPGSVHPERSGLEDLLAMVAGGFAIAVVSLADTSVLSRTFAMRAGARVDQDQELWRSARRTSGPPS